MVRSFAWWETCKGFDPHTQHPAAENGTERQTKYILHCSLNELAHFALTSEVHRCHGIRKRTSLFVCYLKGFRGKIKIPNMHNHLSEICRHLSENCNFLLFNPGRHWSGLMPQMHADHCDTEWPFHPALHRDFISCEMKKCFLQTWR